MAEEEAPEEVTADAAEQDEAEVEGHSISVQLFHADGRVADIHCGAYYSDN